MSLKRRFWTVGLIPFRIAIAVLLIGAMRAFGLLPYHWQLAIGKKMGATAERLLPTRRKIVQRNLRACFPEMTDEQRARLCREHFESLGASIAETTLAWFGSLAFIRSIVEIRGLENLRAALERGRGVIVFFNHFTNLELIAPALTSACPRFCGMFKKQRNPFINTIMTRGRGRSTARLFTHRDVRGMLQELAANSVVWYASDQSFGGKGAELIPLLGQPAMTNTAISRIARSSRAVVLPSSCRRLPDDSGYVITLGAPLENFPSDDPAADTRRLSIRMDDYIREAPEQYWWIHKRFKGRPAELPDIYA